MLKGLSSRKVENHCFRAISIERSPILFDEDIESLSVACWEVTSWFYTSRIVYSYCGGCRSQGRPRLEDSGSGRLLGQWQEKGLLSGLGGVKQGTKIPFRVSQGPRR